jgi:2-oxoglutarate ferredoxin oxidoreductase subunit alpha
MLAFRERTRRSEMVERRLIQGDEACAQGAIAAGCRFFGGYPISPSSEIAEYMARELPRHGGVFIQMEDELASLGSVLGASLAGSKAMTATSGPGFTLMQEHLGYATLAEIPCVVADVMRLGPSTGLPTSPSQGDVMQAKWGSHGDRSAVALAPGTVKEIYDLTIRAFDVAERLRTPVTLLFDETMGHMREGVTLSEPDPNSLWHRPVPQQVPGHLLEAFVPNAEGVAQVPDFGRGFRFHVTGLMHDERGYPTGDGAVAAALLERLERKLAPVEDWFPPEEYRLDDADVVIVAYGIMGRVAKQAVDRLRAEGSRVGMFRPTVLWPFPARTVKRATQAARLVVVAEMNAGQWAIPVEVAMEGRIPTVKINSLGIGVDEICEQVTKAAFSEAGVS